MSTSTDKQDVQGRSWDQVTKDGSSSAGSMGAGGTGDSGKLSAGQGQQSDSRGAPTRTDDLLTDGSDEDAGGEGFHSASGQVQTGLEGMGNRTGSGAGNRQSGAPDDQGANARQAADVQRGEGNAGREDGQKR